MALEEIGKVKSQRGHQRKVWWNPADKRVYVEYGGKTEAGKANNASHAMHVAEAFFANKHDV